MRQHKHHLVLHLLLGPGHNQTKKFCVWGLGLLIPLLLLFCVFPSGTSLYKPPHNRIVISQLQVPSLRARSGLKTLPSDADIHLRAVEKLSTSSADEPHLASTKANRQNDGGPQKKKSRKQNIGIKTEASGMDSSTSPENTESAKKKKKKYNGPNISTLVDKDQPDEQVNAEDIQPNRSTRKPKIKQNKSTMNSGTAVEEKTSSSGKRNANEDDEAFATSHIPKSRRGRKPDKEEVEEVSSLGREIGANEQYPKGQKSGGSKEHVNSREWDDEEAVSLSGKGKKRRRRSAEDADGDHEADLRFLENADKEAFLLESSAERQQPFRVASVADDDVDASGEGRSIDATFNSKQSDKCRYYEGRWINDLANHLYEDSACTLTSIDVQESCKDMSKQNKPNGWRWQPNCCKMKQFKVKNFLKMMRRRSLAFVGDQLAKAQMKSLVCNLAQVEKPSLIYEDKTNKSTSWHFTTFNFTISMIWSPYLVQEVDENGYTKLHLDKLDIKWATMVPTLDVIVLGVGSLLLRPTIYTIHDEVVGCYACKDLNTYSIKADTKEISLYSGFRAIMRSSLIGIGALPGFEGATLFLQPFGFEGNGSYHSVSMKMKDIQEEELYQAHKRGSIPNQSKMEVLHTDFISMSKYDDIQGPKNFSCLVPSPLARTWNEVLQHTLTSLLHH